MRKTRSENSRFVRNYGIVAKREALENFGPVFNSDRKLLYFLISFVLQINFLYFKYNHK